MSYILEALKKSEAERRLGDVPDLNTPPLPKRTVEGDVRPRPSRRYGLGVLFLLLVVNLGITAWLLLDRKAAEHREVAVADGPDVGPVRTVQPVVPQPSTSRAGIRASKTDRSPASSRLQPDPVLRPKRLSESRVAAGPAPGPEARARIIPVPEPVPATGKVVTARNTAGQAPVADRSGRVPVWDELPLSVRSAFHRPHVDVHVYDPDPARRFVRLDLQKYREGDRTPEGLRVERITREGVVLSWHGNRFLLARP